MMLAIKALAETNFVKPLNFLWFRAHLICVTELPPSRRESNAAENDHQNDLQNRHGTYFFFALCLAGLGFFLACGVGGKV